MSRIKISCVAIRGWSDTRSKSDAHARLSEDLTAKLTPYTTEIELLDLQFVENDDKYMGVGFVGTVLLTENLPDVMPADPELVAMVEATKANEQRFEALRAAAQRDWQPITKQYPTAEAAIADGWGVERSPATGDGAKRWLWVPDSRLFRTLTDGRDEFISYSANELPAALRLPPVADNPDVGLPWDGQKPELKTDKVKDAAAV